MVDMLIMTIRLENSLLDIFLSYISWIYLYISAISMFMLHNGLYIYILFFVITVLYSLLNYKYICIESVSYIIAVFFTILVNYIQNSFISTQVHLVNTNSIKNLFVEFNYTTLGILINLCNIIVLFVLLKINVNYVRKQIIEKETC